MFTLSCRLRVLPPTNLAAVVAGIRAGLSGITVPVSITVGSGGSRALKGAAAGLSATSKAASAAGKSMSNFGEQIGLAGKRFLAFTLATSAVLKFFGAIKSGLGDAVKFERELVRVSQVTGTTLKNLSGLTEQISSLSKTLGVSSMKLVESSRILAQTGMSADEVTTSLKALAMTELSATFDDISKTTEGSIAIMRQFKKGAEDLESVLGSVNLVAAKFAVESDDIVTAVRRSGGAFAAAGGDIDEFMALFTSVRATTRESAESIATGFRTIFTRMQRSRTQDFLKTLGVDLRNLEGQFVGPYEAVRRLSMALKDVRGTDPRFSQVIEELGGFRQVSKVIPLIQEFETSERALAVSQTGHASLARDAAKAQQALAVQITKVKEEFAAMIRKFAENDSFKAMVGFIFKMASAFTRVAESLEPLMPMLITLASLQIGRSVGPIIAGVKNKGFGFASGGVVPGSGNRDTVPAMLTPGEFVIRKSAVEAIGSDRLSKMNSGGMIRHYASAGYVEGFKPHLTGRGVAEGNVGRRKQYMVQKLEFLLAKAKAGTLTQEEMLMLNSLASQVGTISQNRKQRFGKRFAFAEGGPVDIGFIGLDQKGRMDGLKPMTITNEDMGFKTTEGKEIKKQVQVYYATAGQKIDELTKMGVKSAVGDLVFDLGRLYSSIGVTDVYGELKNKYSQSKNSKVTIPNLKGIIGGVFEGAVAQTGAPYDSGGKFDDQKRIDFPHGIGKVGANLFNAAPLAGDVPVDAKKNLQNSAKSIKKKIVNYVKNKYYPESNIQQKSTKSTKSQIKKEARFNKDIAAVKEWASLSKGTRPQFAIERLSKKGGLLEGLKDKPEMLAKLTAANYASGGPVDSVPAMLTPGEFVVNKDSASRIGVSTLNKLNSVKGYASGGPVGFAGGGLAGIGMGFAGLSGLISQFDNLGDETQKLLNGFTSFAAQFATFKMAAGAAGEWGGKFEKEISESTFAVAKFRDMSTGLTDKIEAAGDAWAEAYLDKGSDPLEVARLHKEWKMLEEEQQAIDDLIKEKEREVSSIKKWQKANQMLSTGIAVLAAGLTAWGGKMAQEGRKEIQEGTGTAGKDKFVAGKTMSGFGTGMGIGSSAGQAIGGAIGGIFAGPVGAAVGTTIGNAAGSIIGGTIGAIWAKQLAEEEAIRLAMMRDFTRSNKELTDRLSLLGEGKTTSKRQEGFIRSYTASLSNKMQMADKDSLSEIIETTRSQLDNLNLFIRQTADTVETYGELQDRVGKETISIVAQLSNLNILEMKDRLSEMVETSKKLREKHEDLIKVIDEYAIQMSGLISMSKAFNDAAISVQKFGYRLETLVDFAGGKTTPTKMFDESGMMKASNIQDVINRSIVSSPFLKTPGFGDSGKSVGEEFGADLIEISKVTDALPSILLRFRNSVEAFDEEQITDQFMKNFDEFGPLVRNAMKIKMEEMFGENIDPSKFIAKIKEDLPGALKEFTESFSENTRIFKEIYAKQNEELERQATILSKVSELEQERLNMSLSLIDMQAQQERQMSELRDQSPDLDRMGAYEKRKRTLMTGGFSAEDLAIKLKDSQEKIIKMNDELVTSNKTRQEELIPIIQKEKDAATKFYNALVFLSKSTERGAIVQEKIARENEKSAFKYDMAKRYTFASTLSERRDMSRSAGATMRLAASGGDINMIPPELRDDVLSMLESLGKTTLGSLGKSGNDLIKDTIVKMWTPIFKTFGATDDQAKAQAEELARVKTTNPQEELFRELRAINETSRIAQEGLIQNNVDQQKELMNFLKTSSQQFLNDLKTIFLEDQRAGKEKELAGEVGKREVAYKKFANVGALLKEFGDQNKVDLIDKNYEDIKKILDMREKKRIAETKIGDVERLSWSGAESARGTIIRGGRLEFTRVSEQSDKFIEKIYKDAFSPDQLRELEWRKRTIDPVAKDFLGEKFIKEAGFTDNAAELFSNEYQKLLQTKKNLNAGGYATEDVKNALADAFVSTIQGFRSEFDNLATEENRLKRAFGGMIPPGMLEKIEANREKYDKMFELFEIGDNALKLQQQLKDFDENIGKIDAVLIDINAKLAAMPTPTPTTSPTGAGIVGTAMDLGRRGVDWIRGLFGGSPGFAKGGIVPGRGNRDTVPAMLTPGEIVLPATMADGGSTLKALRQQRREAYLAGKESRKRPERLSERQIANKVEEKRRVDAVVSSVTNFDPSNIATSIGNVVTSGLGVLQPSLEQLRANRIASGKADPNSERQKQAIEMAHNASVSNKKLEQRRKDNALMTPAKMAEKYEANRALAKQRGEAALQKGIEKSEDRQRIIRRKYSESNMIKQQEVKRQAIRDKYKIGASAPTATVMPDADPDVVFEPYVPLSDAEAVGFPAGDPKYSRYDQGRKSTIRRKAENVLDTVYDGLVKSKEEKKKRDLEEQIQAMDVRHRSEGARLFEDRKHGILYSMRAHAGVRERDATKRDMEWERRSQLRRDVDVPRNPYRRLATGGVIGGFGSGDKVPAMLEPGEFVFNRNAVRAVGSSNLDRINRQHSRYQTGGAVTGGAATTMNIEGLNPEIVNMFDAAVKNFGTRIEGFVGAVNNLNGLSLEISGRHTVEVLINGASVFNGLQESIKQLVVGEVNSALSRYVSENLPDLPKPQSAPPKEKV